MIQPVFHLSNLRSTDVSVTLTPPSSTGAYKPTNEQTPPRFLARLGFEVLFDMPVSANCLLYKVAVGTVVNMGCPKKALEENLHHDRKTLNRWSGAMKETDPDKCIRMLNGQGAQRKLNLIEEGQLKSLYFEHRHKKQPIKIIRPKFEKQTRKNIISRKTYYTYFKRFRQAAGEPEPVQSRKAAEAKVTQFAPKLSSIFPESVTYCPAPGEVPIVPEEGEFKHLPDFSQVVSFPRYYHHLGTALLFPWLSPLLLELHAAGEVLPQCLFQLLHEKVNVEQSKTMCPESVSAILGLPAYNRNAQRTSIRDLPVEETICKLLKCNLSVTDASRSRFMYFDGHEKEYTGSRHFTKGYLGNRHSIAKILNIDLIHTATGMPCYAQVDDNFSTFADRFFRAALFFTEQSGLIEFYWVIDREIYSLHIFLEIGAQLKCGLITWEKYYNNDGWDETLSYKITIVDFEYNEPGNMRATEVKYQSYSWAKCPGVTRIIIRTRTEKGKEFEASVLVSHPPFGEPAAIEDIIHAMLRRWCEENNIRYLVEHTGLNQMVTYKYDDYREIAPDLQDRPMITPEYKKLKKEEAKAQKKAEKAEEKTGQLTEAINENQKEIQDLEACVKANLAQVQQLFEAAKTTDTLLTSGQEKEIDTCIKNYRKNRRTLTKLRQKVEDGIIQQEEQQTQIKTLHKQLTVLRQQLSETRQIDSRIAVFIKQGMQRQQLGPKAIHDSLRLLACNLIKNLLYFFKPTYHNLRDQLLLLRHVIFSPGQVITDKQGCHYIMIWPSMRLGDNKLHRSLNRLCRQINQIIAQQHAPNPPPVIISITTTDELNE